ncbi:MAG TPA: class II fructose-bisphosphate aldolase [Clostridiaceae bacterium]|nr:class II fructose-bisphosphate aldolase [Clostridiaceae bacterium]
MALVSMKSLMNHALENKYAVGYFESWNLESVLSVIDAAERTNSPVIIGFSGMFLGNDERKVEENIYHYGSLGKAIAENSKVPVALLLNEADKVSILINGLKAGFNAIMYQDPKKSFEETIEITKYITRTAHYVGADVEAEVGELPNADIASNTVKGGELTDPDKAEYFVEQTEVDALAVSIGNVHLLEGKKSELDFDLLKTLRKRIKVPLVLHGGTGISEDNLKEAIKLGMCKINVGTVLKRVFINYIQTYLKSNNVDSIDPHEVIGKGGAKDMLCGAREAMSEEIIRFIKIFGSENKAKMM